jgi:hypothetical protein
MAYSKGKKSLSPTSRAVVASLKPKAKVGKGSGEMKSVGKSEMSNHTPSAKMSRLKSGY